MDPDLHNVLTVRLSGANLPETLREIDAVWHDFVPSRPINRAFLDDRLAVLYVDFAHEGQVFSGFAFVSVAIGCLGLIGLSAYAAERRTKEIGIRKAHGATVANVTRLLVWQFTRPVLLSNILAAPIAWWSMRHWLDGFAYRVDLGPVPFLLAGIGAVAIAVATTAASAMNGARVNPAKALRCE
jgi:putative ABC transport system permease protein